MSIFPGGSAGGAEVGIDFGPPGRYISIPFQNTGVEKPIWSGRATLAGYNLAEPTATAGVDCIIYDGEDVTGSALIYAYMIAGRRCDLWIGRNGPPIERGLFMHMIGGQLFGVIWVWLDR